MSILSPEISDLPLKEQAYTQIKKLILNEEIPVNSFLSERGLAEQLGMSKTPVRLAIERLDNEGFVKVSPQQGIMVLSLSFEEILDYIDYRIALESFVVKHIAGELSEQQIKLLKANLKEHQALIKKEDKDEQRKSEAIYLKDREFHRLLFSFHGNKPISQSLSRQEDMMHRIAVRTNKKYPQRPIEAQQDHKAIADAIIQGDKAEAIRLLEKHLGLIKTLLIGQR